MDPPHQDPPPDRPDLVDRRRARGDLSDHAPAPGDLLRRLRRGGRHLAPPRLHRALDLCPEFVRPPRRGGRSHPRHRRFHRLVRDDLRLPRPADLRVGVDPPSRHSDVHHRLHLRGALRLLRAGPALPRPLPRPLQRDRPEGLGHVDGRRDLPDGLRPLPLRLPHHAGLPREAVGVHPGERPHPRQIALADLLPGGPPDGAGRPWPRAWPSS